jgi:hypothetical protein
MSNLTAIFLNWGIFVLQYKKKENTLVGCQIFICCKQSTAGLFSSNTWEQGFDKVCESSRTLELFEQFDVQCQKWRILLVSEVILVQNLLELS